MTTTYSGPAAVAMVVAFASVLAGCAAPPQPKVEGPDPARVALEQSIKRHAQAEPHTASAERPAPAAVMSGNSLTIRAYQGDAANLISRVAKARGLSFKVNGPEPRLPLFVAIDVSDVTLEEFLNQVGHQFGQRADLVLANSHIEIRYRGQ
jgi:hypothetical protein